MKIKTRCNHCGKVYQMAADYIGKTAQCKQCQNNFVMVALEEAPPAPQPAPADPFEVPLQAVGAPFNPFGGASQPGGAPANPFGAPPPPGGNPADPFGASGNPFAARPQPGPPGRYPFGAAPGQPAAPPHMEGLPGQPFAAPPPPGPGPGQLNTQTVVCPKCKFTADIPPVSGKMHLRCQECGHKFMVKPEPKKKGAFKAKAAPYPDAPAKKGLPKAALVAMLLLLLAAVLFVGPALLPDIIPNLLP